MDGSDKTGGAASALSPAHVGGRRRRSAKKLRVVKKSTVRRMLKSRGLKMRGGGDPVAGEVVDGGRRHRKSHGRRSHRKSRRGGILHKFGF